MITSRRRLVATATIEGRVIEDPASAVPGALDREVEAPAKLARPQATAPTMGHHPRVRVVARRAAPTVRVAMTARHRGTAFVPAPMMILVRHLRQGAAADQDRQPIFARKSRRWTVTPDAIVATA